VSKPRNMAVSGVGWANTVRSSRESMQIFDDHNDQGLEKQAVRIDRRAPFAAQARQRGLGM
jgi:hypothetical protein